MACEARCVLSISAPLVALRLAPYLYSFRLTHLTRPRCSIPILVIGWWWCLQLIDFWFGICRVLVVAGAASLAAIARVFLAV